MEDILDDEEDFWPAALDCGRFEGVLYGIPYECQIQTLICSKEMTESDSIWTVDEMVDVVSKSEAKAMARGNSGASIVYLCGLKDKSNTAYIDWEKGVSHLTEAPFQKLLQFAKEYRDDGSISMEDNNYVTALQSAGLDTFSRMLYYKENRYGDETAFVGFPSTEGGVHYILSTNFYMNSASKKREGVKEFINYLLSEEMLKEYLEYSPTGIVTTFHLPALPIRLSTLEYSIKLLLDDSTSGFTEEDAETARQILAHARPLEDDTKAIFSIIAEELSMYFAGNVSLEEVAKVMDNRVQLYLNEKK